MLDQAAVDQNLKSLVENFEWVLLTKKRPSKLPSDKLFLTIKSSAPKKTSDLMDSINLRIGNEICAKLGWQLLDKILVFHHPINCKQIMLIKSTSDNGYKLNKDHSPSVLALSFKWRDASILNGTSNKVLDFHIYEGRLIFTLE